MGTDTATLIRRSARLEIDDLDFDSFRLTPLDEQSLRCLRYMHDVEGHTMCYLRDVLATHAHRDPDITAFLACWSYEEHWHGDAIAKVLKTHGEVAGPSRLAAARRRLPKRDALRPVFFAIGSAVMRQLTALQMAWGAVNELSTQAGYARLAQKARHPVLSELLRRIMRQEGRHIDFYAAEARQLLGTSRIAQRLTRFALMRAWAPVGSGVMPPSEVGFLVAHLFGDEEGVKAARRIDKQVDRLPGLEGLHLVETAATRIRPLGT
ncbi:MAG TPA: ferritin-like domain-containing protein [Acidimicrobiales bacterium]|nr:ferritin-like domain-containing protein [Acidimicrobiales bacterium]